MSFSFADYQNLRNNPTTQNGITTFWHETDSDTGIFSNWAATPLYFDNRRFSSSEHLFMYTKAKLFNDQNIMHKLQSPGLSQLEIKQLGRQVQNFKQDTWDKHKYHFMYVATLAKAQQNPLFRSSLSGTNNTLIIEASPRDNIWGAGIKASDPRISNPSDWPGENALGTILMMVRSEINAE